MNDFPNVSFIIIGSEERLSKVKSYQIEDGVECLLCPFLNIDELPSLLDSKIAELDSIAISIIPAGAFPKKNARKQLVHFSRSEYQFWGWYHFGNKFKGAIQNIGKINTFLNKVPQLEQGIFFTKSLYFSVGGLGEIKSNPFAELAKRFYLRLDPQKPLPSLTIRSKSLLN
ncbi:MAG: hypothetical protein ACJ0FP_00770 [Gammaproteobacteria bacterium]|uniref:Uncharacterized protein n=1 Tax=SAR86 cluster bacterium TaxID=2030880 RepID=A0A368BJI8_9GAMM|nr:hypothetical protein [Gammaproteobacteria bacterium]RCL37469.1 MAG: hypothetical protein DBW98_03810 [SAR86 cluster bacterium]